MELWAAGFNAWGQLEFEKPEVSSSVSDDLGQFTCIMRDGKICVLKSTFSTTIVGISDRTRAAGSPDDILTNLTEQGKLKSSAIAGNDKICQLKGNAVIQYSSAEDYRKGIYETLEDIGAVIQLEAGQTGFTALTTTGKVYSWGDERYGQCLGREIDEDLPASKPCIVEDLADLPNRIIKISSSGYVTAALTSANDAYFWGRGEDPKDLISAFPTPLDLDGQDILDVAVGFNHIVVLTTERKVFIVGDNGNGQLGLAIEKSDDWREAPLPLSNGQRVSGIYAGYKNTFVLVEDEMA
ncbi:regulator of chromosome condensation 1/beta-lactamase-inhibitor protein II [Calycina marina]|uniref:Regulator of chromosome condensation 1/beta-lactamase-inhibitor protein II n=1 Tax=Calycina marina TaxID=1763456 RepID=A0A9P7ZAX7_9HELO|nr:regulator of chromosome condensation 1/beta-lactamase-inhibitor protein II [Calycina marina]